jgi:hypothetical protein
VFHSVLLYVLINSNWEVLKIEYCLEFKIFNICFCKEPHKYQITLNLRHHWSALVLRPRLGRALVKSSILCITKREKSALNIYSKLLYIYSLSLLSDFSIQNWNVHSQFSYDTGISVVNSIKAGHPVAHIHNPGYLEG